MITLFHSAHIFVTPAKPGPMAAIIRVTTIIRDASPGIPAFAAIGCRQVSSVDLSLHRANARGGWRAERATGGVFPGDELSRNCTGLIG